MKSLPRWFVPLFLVCTTVLVVAATMHFSKPTAVYLEGDLEIDPTLEANAKNLRTVFLVLYDATSSASTPMMPLGAVKLKVNADAQGQFLHFVVGESNFQMMNPDAKMPEVVRVKARLDTTGQGGRDKPGDITGELPQVKVGSRDLAVKLNHLVYES